MVKIYTQDDRWKRDRIIPFWITGSTAPNVFYVVVEAQYDKLFATTIIPDWVDVSKEMTLVFNYRVGTANTTYDNQILDMAAHQPDIAWSGYNVFATYGVAINVSSAVFREKKLTIDADTFEHGDVVQIRLGKVDTNVYSILYHYVYLEGVVQT